MLFETDAPGVQGAKLEVESVIRSVCDEVLNDKDVNANTRALRATALRLMGEVSCAVKAGVGMSLMFEL